jgi:hypothetical protein
MDRLLGMPQVGLHKLRFTSFYTERGHKLQLSASDVALGVSALLEVGVLQLNTSQSQNSLMTNSIYEGFAILCTTKQRLR